MTVSERIIEIIKAIPVGKVMGYGDVAKLAGCPNGARTVARILHSSSVKHNLPWWRVVRSSGAIALPMDSGGALQKELLQGEGVLFSSDKAISGSCIV